MKKIIIYICLTLCYLPSKTTWGASADSSSGMAEDSLPSLARHDRILTFFSNIQSQRREKLYLHLNQPYYGVGDTIWFRAYLTDAVTHRPDTLSNFIYVDLYDRVNVIPFDKLTEFFSRNLK